MNSQGTLIVRMTKNPKDFTIQKTIQLVHDAQARSTPLLSASRRIVATTLCDSCTHRCGVDLFRDQILHTKEWSDAFIYRNGSSSRSITLCSRFKCSCRHVISNCGRGEERVLVKGPMFLELLSHTDTIAFDKTGTSLVETHCN